MIRKQTHVIAFERGPPVSRGSARLSYAMPRQATDTRAGWPVENKNRSQRLRTMSLQQARLSHCRARSHRRPCVLLSTSERCDPINSYPTTLVGPLAVGRSDRSTDACLGKIGRGQSSLGVRRFQLFSRPTQAIRRYGLLVASERKLQGQWTPNFQSMPRKLDSHSNACVHPPSHRRRFETAADLGLFDLFRRISTQPAPSSSSSSVSASWRRKGWRCRSSRQSST